MSKRAAKKDIRNLGKVVDSRLKGVFDTGNSADASLEYRLLDMLMSGGPELPASARQRSLKASYMQRGSMLRQQRLEANPLNARPPEQVRMKAHLAIVRVAAVIASVMVLLVGLGFGSAYAMPGNPLYSIKRSAESAYLSVVSGDQDKADAYASWTNRRLNDLEYVEERGMTSWYYSLVGDVQGGIENANQHGKRLRVGLSKRITEKAQLLTLRLEGLLEKALGNMTPAEKAKVESRMEHIRLQLRMRKGNPSEPSQQNGQPGHQKGQQNGQQNDTPSESGSQQEQNQQQQQSQQTQPTSSSQPLGPGGPDQDRGGQEQN
ncbi:MAG: DUF5667 domain-containing protein [Actinomycetota bacterium]|nr:DUF5667 domain-containing protein [Actinomycetota bacterium]